MVTTAKLSLPTAAIVLLAAPLVSATGLGMASCGDASVVDCQVSDWVVASTCDPITLTQTYKRTITTTPQNGGHPCPSLEKTEACKLDECAVTSWGPWVCDDTTSNKTQTRTLVDDKAQGCVVPMLTQTLPCDPVDCQLGPRCAVETVGDFNAKIWMKTKNPVIQEPKYSGKACPSLAPLEPAGDVCYCRPELDTYTPCVATLAKANLQESTTFSLMTALPNSDTYLASFDGLDMWECVDKCVHTPTCGAFQFVRESATIPSLCGISQIGRPALTGPLAAGVVSGLLKDAMYQWNCTTLAWSDFCSRDGSGTAV